MEFYFNRKCVANNVLYHTDFLWRTRGGSWRKIFFIYTKFCRQVNVTVFVNNASSSLFLCVVVVFSLNHTTAVVTYGFMLHAVSCWQSQSNASAAIVYSVYKTKSHISFMSNSYYHLSDIRTSMSCSLFLLAAVFSVKKYVKGCDKHSRINSPFSGKQILLGWLFSQTVPWYFINLT